MIIMPANNTSGLVHWLAGIAPGALGHLYTPARDERPKPYLPYGLDNGAFARKQQGFDYDEVAWGKCLEKFCQHHQKPLWLVVPDVVYDGAATLKRWHQLAHLHQHWHVPLAMAVQDGISVDDVRRLTIRPDVIFIGGTTDWKWASLPDWCAAFPRVHVARVNGRRGLDLCHAAGAESCDGSGWFRGHAAQLLMMTDFICEHHGVDHLLVHEVVKAMRHQRSMQGVLAV